MARKKLPYQEGDWFAVPLGDGSYAVGLVARMDRKGGVLGYFFGPRREQPPAKADIMHLTHADAVWISHFGDLGLLEGLWPIIGRVGPWNRADWPMPVFGAISVDGRYAWRAKYDENTLEIVSYNKVHPDKVRGLPEDGSSGAGSVEILLTKLLCGSEAAARLAERYTKNEEVFGYDIFNSDAALDVRDVFEDVLAEGRDIPAATTHVLQELADYVDDMDDGPVVYLALATLQLEHGALQPEIRARALHVITTGQDLQRWEDPVDRAARQHVLEQLRARLSME
jgi:hypothetical protein